MHARARFGILGTLGALLFVVWFVGWVLFGLHDGYWHALVPISAAMMIIQGVRRVAAPSAHW